MSLEAKLALAGVVVVIITVIVAALKLIIRRAPMKLKKSKFKKEWRTLQANCKQKETWPNAIIQADKLLDKALIKRGFKGKNTGERIVSAQREFSDNDALWHAHKLSRKLEDDPSSRLTTTEVKKALLTFAQALKDIGAL